MLGLYCKTPFVDMHLDTGGKVHLCCSHWAPFLVGNVFENDLIDIWQCEKAKEFRESVTDGSFKHCLFCPYLPGPNDNIVTLDKSGPPSTSRIENVTLSYDSYCNLACASCRTGFVRSSNPKAYPINEKILESRFLLLVDRLMISGNGDPFASPVYFNLLKNLKSTDQPKLKITLFTNAQLFTKSNWEILSGINTSIDHVMVSVDASSETTYAKNRQGGKWSRLLENLSFIAQLGLSRFEFMFVVQDNNVHEMISFLNLATSYGATKICFMELRDLGNYQGTEKPYESRSIHNPNHPRHNELLSSLRSVKDWIAKHHKASPEIMWIGFNNPNLVDNFKVKSC